MYKTRILWKHCIPIVFKYNFIGAYFCGFAYRVDYTTRREG